MKHVILPVELPTDQLQALMANVLQKENDCWTWQGNVRHGYGIMYLPQAKCSIRIHRLMWQVFNKQEIPATAIVRHLCHNRVCCNPHHLAIGTHADNAQDKVNANRQSKGYGTGNAKLTEKEVVEIRTRYATENVSEESLAKQYKIGKTIIGNILLGQKWKHLPGLIKYVDYCPVRMIKNKPVFTEKQIIEIRLKRYQNQTLESIAHEYGVGISTIERITKGYSYPKYPGLIRGQDYLITNSDTTFSDEVVVPLLNR